MEDGIIWLNRLVTRSKLLKVFKTLNMYNQGTVGTM